MSKSGLQLKVKEAHYQDVGKGRARISKINIKELGLIEGDVIEIKGPGNKKTTAIVWASFTDADLSTIAIDTTIRTNAGVRLDEIVYIKKAVSNFAQKVILVSPKNNIRISNIESFLYQKFQGRPVSIDDKIAVEYMGNRFEYKVIGLTPPIKSAIVNKETIIETTTPDFEASDLITEYKVIPKIAYEDIGGMDETIQRIREMVELPMRYPELFERLGVEPPKGVLLYGPPGTGKTLLAKAVANETDSHFIHVSGPEVMSKFYGESEQKIRAYFDEAREKSPSIIFLDEIDSITPKRDDKGAGEVERRIVSQMLALMDGLESRGEIIVIGATNRANAIDPALRRPGRFDREIEIGVPDQNGRLIILTIHTRSMPLGKDVDLEAIARRTHGFVGADLASLTKEAAMRAIRRVFPKIVWGEEIPMEIINQITVQQADFEAALAEMKPSALREVFVEIPTVTWDQVGGLNKIKDELKEIIELPSMHPHLFSYMGSQIPRGLLLTGKPGTGKTLMVRAVANESSRNFITLKCSEILSKWAGESEKAIQETFRKARLAAPSIIFFDEIDAIVPSRGSKSSDVNLSDRIVTTLLTEMDGLEELNDVIVIAATNRPDIIDPALMRPGRFERVIDLPLPDEKSRLEIFQVLTKSKPLSPKVSLMDLSKRTDGLTGADLKGIVSRAIFISINRFLAENKNPLKNLSKEEERAYIEKKKPVIEEIDLNLAIGQYITRK